MSSPRMTTMFGLFGFGWAWACARTPVANSAATRRAAAAWVFSWLHLRLGGFPFMLLPGADGDQWRGGGLPPLREREQDHQEWTCLFEARSVSAFRGSDPEVPVGHPPRRRRTARGSGRAPPRRRRTGRSCRSGCGGAAPGASRRVTACAGRARPSVRSAAHVSVTSAGSCTSTPGQLEHEFEHGAGLHRSRSCLRESRTEGRRKTPSVLFQTPATPERCGSLRGSGGLTAVRRTNTTASPSFRSSTRICRPRAVAASGRAPRLGRSRVSALRAVVHDALLSRSPRCSPLFERPLMDREVLGQRYGPADDIIWKTAAGGTGRRRFAVNFASVRRLIRHRGGVRPGLRAPRFMVLGSGLSGTPAPALTDPAVEVAVDDGGDLQEGRGVAVPEADDVRQGLPLPGVGDGLAVVEAIQGDGLGGHADATDRQDQQEPRRGTKLSISWEYLRQFPPSSWECLKGLLEVENIGRQRCSASSWPSPSCSAMRGESPLKSDPASLSLRRAWIPSSSDARSSLKSTAKGCSRVATVLSSIGNLAAVSVPSTLRRIPEPVRMTEIRISIRYFCQASWGPRPRSAPEGSQLLLCNKLGNSRT